MAMTLYSPTGRFQRIGAGLLTLGLAGTVGTALLFQHLWGYMPCKLCLEQRVPYYVAIPVALLAVAAMAVRAPAYLSRGLLLAVGALMIWSLWLAGTHAGVEWGWWPGPNDCGMVPETASGGTGGVLDALDTVVPPSCDEAAGRFLGLSFAGWNFVSSLFLSALALTAALRRN